MRKRAQRKSISVEEKTIPTLRKEPIQEKKITTMFQSKNWWTAIILIGIFCAVLFMNAYFHYTSGFAVNPEAETLAERYLLLGPDPYYNMRLVEGTLETGQYPYYSERDPLLNYPLGRLGGSRAPLMNIMAIGLSRLLLPIMDPVDAVGFSMQFLPALFGALLVFPVYFIGKTVFGTKAGILGALFIAFSPIHLGGGHGSAFSLFDHDSINLFLFFIIFLFLIKAYKEDDRYKQLIYSLLAGVGVAGISMIWVEDRFIYTIVALYAIIQMLFDIFNNKIEVKSALVPSVILLSGYLFSLPVKIAHIGYWSAFPDLRLLLGIGVLLFGVLYLLFKVKQIPWTLSLPIVFSFGGIVLAMLYFIDAISKILPALSSLQGLANIIYGAGIYGRKVSDTIAEAGRYDISRTWMSYNPMILLLAIIGFALLIYLYFKPTLSSSKTYKRRDFLFLIIIFLINVYLIGIAGRFLNDFVPVVTILAGWIFWAGLKRFDYKSMIKNIKNAGGGFHGLKKGVSIYQVVGILLIVSMFLVPKVGLAHLAFDAAIPSASTQNDTSNLIRDVFGDDYGGAFSAGVYTESYWADAFSWLNKQNEHITNYAERPAIISWWDYGFYEVAVGKHPTVADNFQSGIPPASNFQTAQSEIEGVAVWCVRLLEGDKNDNNGEISSATHAVLNSYFNENTTLLVNIIEDPQTYAPSYDTLIAEEFGNTELRVHAPNAMYHDAVDMIMTLDDDIIWLYNDLQETTGYSIRYYAVEGYDLNIFSVFTYLSDKGTHGFITSEDDFYKTTYIDGQGGSHTLEEILEMSQAQLMAVGGIVDQRTERKDAFFNSMVYQAYIGPLPKETFNQFATNGQELLRRGYAPTAGMKHFAVQYISPFSYARGGAPLGLGLPAVVIAKYYAGAFLNGTVLIGDTPAPFVQAVVYDEFGIPHDNVLSDENGQFRLIAVGGNITLRLSYANQVILKDITFNTTEHPPISDDEAMRRVADYTRQLNISIGLSTLDGYVYEDVDDDGVFNPDVDTPLSGITIELVDEFGLHPNPTPLITDEQGYFVFDELFPSIYTLTALENGFELYSDIVIVEPGEKTINISKPKLSSLEGIVYFDANMDGEYTASEEMSEVIVNLIYGRTEQIVDTYITDVTGSYSFADLIPGEYIIEASKSHPTTGYNEYSVEDVITLDANETVVADISIGYAPIIVSGTTQANGVAVGNIQVFFDEDFLVENNTAVGKEIQSTSTGTYQVELQPGSYEVIVEMSDEEIGTYTFSDTLSLTPGQGVYEYTIELQKHSVSVSGMMTYNQAPKGNLTAFFRASLVEDNTAVSASTLADASGSYRVELMPGWYDVNVSQIVEENGVRYRYLFTDTIEISLLDDPKTYHIALTRVEVL